MTIRPRQTRPLLPCGEREFIRVGGDEFALLTGPLSDQVKAGCTPSTMPMTPAHRRYTAFWSDTLAYS